MNVERILDVKYSHWLEISTGLPVVEASPGASDRAPARRGFDFTARNVLFILNGSPV